MAKTWSQQIRQQDKDRKALARAREIRARKARADNRRHAMEHPVSHLFGKLFGG